MDTRGIHGGDEFRHDSVNGIIVGSAGGLGERVITNGAKRSVDENIEALGFGVAIAGSGIARPSAFEVQGFIVVSNGGIAMLDEFFVAVLLSASAYELMGEESSSGGKLVEIEARGICAGAGRGWRDVRATFLALVVVA